MVTTAVLSTEGTPSYLVSGGTITSVTIGADTFTTLADGGPILVADLDAGPLCLRDVEIAPSALAPDETATRVPGVWLYLASGGLPVATYDWRLDTVSVGASGTTYASPTAGDLTVQERLTQPALGSRTRVSVAVTVVEPVTAFTDDFNRANQTLASSVNWDNIVPGGLSGSHVGDLHIVSNQLEKTTADNEWQACLATRTMANNQYAQMQVVSNGGGAGSPARLLLRAATGDNFYAVEAEANGTGLSIRRRVGGAWLTQTNGSHAASHPFTLRFEAEGTTLRAKINGATVLTTTDASLSSGKAGVAVRRQGGQTATIDNFECGDL